MSTTKITVPLYDHSKNKFTKPGNALFHLAFQQNPNPQDDVIQKLSDETGAPLIKCRAKFTKLKSVSKNQNKIIAASSSLPKPVPVVPVIPVVPVVPAETSKSNLFLNRIKGPFLETLYTSMISNNVLDHINPKNLVFITADQIKPLKSYNEKNGPFILNWLSCQVEPRYITNSPQCHPKLTLNNSDAATTIKCEKFNAEKKQIMNELNIKRIALYKHHVVLLRTKSIMPVFDTTTTVSHLCDTPGCLRPSHIIDESMDINISRQRCAGMVISIRDDSITNVRPCQHGLEGCGPNDDPFELTCRKIRAIYHSPRACALLDSLKK